jgi:hypothetical protein
MMQHTTNLELNKEKSQRVFIKKKNHKGTDVTPDVGVTPGKLEHHTHKAIFSKIGLFQVGLCAASDHSL